MWLPACERRRYRQRQPSIGVSRNAYIADGVSISDAGYGGMGVYSPSYGSLGTGINLSFIQEAGQDRSIEPKYGGVNGGVVDRYQVGRQPVSWSRIGLRTGRNVNGYKYADNARLLPGLASARLHLRNRLMMAL